MKKARDRASISIPSSSAIRWALARICSVRGWEKLEKCYSSVDLYNWKDEGIIIQPDTGDIHSSLHPGDFELAAEDGKGYYYFERVHSETICADLTEDYTDVTGYYSTHFPHSGPPYVQHISKGRESTIC